MQPPNNIILIINTDHHNSQHTFCDENAIMFLSLEDCQCLMNRFDLVDKCALFKGKYNPY